MLFQNIIPKLNIGVLGCSSNLESLMSLPSVRFVSVQQIYSFVNILLRECQCNFNEFNNIN